VNSAPDRNKRAPGTQVKFSKKEKHSHTIQVKMQLLSRSAPAVVAIACASVSGASAVRMWGRSSAPPPTHGPGSLMGGDSMSMDAASAAPGGTELRPMTGFGSDSAGTSGGMAPVQEGELTDAEMADGQFKIRRIDSEGDAGGIGNIGSLMPRGSG